MTLFIVGGIFIGLTLILFVHSLLFQNFLRNLCDISQNIRWALKILSGVISFFLLQLGAIFSILFFFLFFIDPASFSVAFQSIFIDMSLSAFLAFKCAQRFTESLFLLFGVMSQPVIVEMLRFFKSLGANIASKFCSQIVVVVCYRAQSIISFMAYSFVFV